MNSGASFFGDAHLKPEEIAALTDEIFAAHDADGSGSLDYKEYLSAIVANPYLVTFISGNGSLSKEASIKELPADIPAEAEAAVAEPAPAPAEAPAAEA